MSEFLGELQFTFKYTVRSYFFLLLFIVSSFELLVFRFLLISIALLSAYSIHLLLKSAEVVGEKHLLSNVFKGNPDSMKKASHLSITFVCVFRDPCI